MALYSSYSFRPSLSPSLHFFMAMWQKKKIRNSWKCNDAPSIYNWFFPHSLLCAAAPHHRTHSWYNICVISTKMPLKMIYIWKSINICGSQQKNAVCMSNSNAISLLPQSLNSFFILRSYIKKASTNFLFNIYMNAICELHLSAIEE